MPLLGLEQTAQDAGRQAELAKRSNGIFIASLISILFCCLGGIIASILANRAKDDAAAGNLESAERNINLALGFMIASFVIGGLSVLGQLSQMR